ncbi:MAG: transglycosylase domain-containing protein [Bacillus sp. (in: firmicutes)]
MRFLKKTVKLFLLFTILIAALTAGLGYLYYQQAIAQEPLTEKVQAIRNRVGYTAIESISPDFTDAIVAIEDRRFFKHGPIDPVALARAAVVNLLKGEKEQGGSTLTQQVAKNLYFSHEKLFIRKVAEAFVAYDLEKAFTKDEILELYVNIIYYGDGNNGIYEASTGYFGKMPADLSFEEATLLAGLPQSPSSYALSTHYDRAKKRQSVVIEALQEYRNSP